MWLVDNDSYISAQIVGYLIIKPITAGMSLNFTINPTIKGCHLASLWPSNWTKDVTVFYCENISKSKYSLGKDNACLYNTGDFIYNDKYIEDLYSLWYLS